jgi:hypothetical protein
LRSFRYLGGSFAVTPSGQLTLDASLQRCGITLRCRFGKARPLLPQRSQRFVKLAVATDAVESECLPVERVRGVR